MLTISHELVQLIVVLYIPEPHTQTMGLRIVKLLEISHCADSRVGECGAVSLHPASAALRSLAAALMAVMTTPITVLLTRAAPRSA